MSTVVVIVVVLYFVVSIWYAAANFDRITTRGPWHETVVLVPVSTIALVVGICFGLYSVGRVAWDSIKLTRKKK